MMNPASAEPWRESLSARRPLHLGERRRWFYVRRKNRQLGGMLGLGSRWSGSPPAGSFVSVSAGFAHTCGVKSDGSTTCWGRNIHGESTLGHFIALSSGGDETCGLEPTGSVVCWGSGPGFDHSLGPMASISVGGGTSIHACGVQTDGLVACWVPTIMGRPTLRPAVSSPSARDGITRVASGRTNRLPAGEMTASGDAVPAERQSLNWTPGPNLHVVSK